MKLFSVSIVLAQIISPNFCNTVQTFVLQHLKKFYIITELSFVRPSYCRTLSFSVAETDAKKNGLLYETKNFRLVNCVVFCIFSRQTVLNRIFIIKTFNYVGFLFISNSCYAFQQGILTTRGEGSHFVYFQAVLWTIRT